MVRFSQNAQKKAATNRPFIKPNRILTMIATAFDLDSDQQRCEQQATITEELFINGESDGYCNGIRPVSSDSAYMAGYSQGLRRKMIDIKRQALLLEQEGLAVEARVEAIFGEKIPFY